MVIGIIVVAEIHCAVTHAAVRSLEGTLKVRFFAGTMSGAYNCHMNHMTEFLVYVLLTFVLCFFVLFPAVHAIMGVSMGQLNPFAATEMGLGQKGGTAVEERERERELIINFQLVIVLKTYMY
ncbi:hypothetical protein ACJX0J_038956, partial [Zea mays]